MRGDNIPIRQWRVLGCPHGYLVFVDPRVETLRISEGMDENLQRVMADPPTVTDDWIQQTLFPERPSTDEDRSEQDPSRLPTDPP